MPLQGLRGPRQCNNIVSKVPELLEHTGWNPIDTYLGDFKNSALLKPEGVCMKMLREGSRKEGEKTLGALWAAVAASTFCATRALRRPLRHPPACGRDRLPVAFGYIKLPSGE